MMSKFNLRVIVAELDYWCTSLIWVQVGMSVHVQSVGSHLLYGIYTVGVVNYIMWGEANEHHAS